MSLYHEFLSFERGNVSDNNSNVVVQELNYNGATNNYVFITNDNYINRYPSIAFRNLNFNHSIENAILVWETNRNGNFDIYISKYLNGIWSDPFPVDSGNGDQKNAKVIAFNDTNYCITYQSNDDIFYLLFNFNTNQVSQKTNITVNEPEACFNPHINVSGNFNIYITYEKEISPGRKAIFYRQGTINSMPSTGNLSDTIAYAGNNVNSGFTFIQGLEAVFESDRTGPSNIYMTRFYNFSQVPAIVHNSFTNYSYKGVDIIITDNLNTNLVFSYLRKSSSNISFVLRQGGWFPWSDSLSIIASNSPDFNAVSVMSNSIANPQASNCYRHWFLYTKDTSLTGTPSLIYGTYFTNCLAGIPNNNSEIKSFHLHQNYPNPFNPVTNIKFSLPARTGGPTTQYTILRIFDITGREVETLINEVLQAGSYEFTFDAAKLSSGIYFYQLKADGFVQTRKMVLTK
jgi:hypothetical protein